MDWTGSQIFEWTLLGGFLAILIYTMRVIKREKDVFLENPNSFYLADFHFRTPKWWSPIVADQKNSLRFKRDDTRYDWRSKFEWFSLPDENMAASTLLKNKIAEQEIFFDKDYTIIHNPESLKEQFSNEIESWDIVRVEGTATRSAEDRLYYDGFLMVNEKRAGYLYCESISSVLNGMVEGPYFEEVVKRVELIDSSSEKRV
jgi:hypothetical protein